MFVTLSALQTIEHLQFKRLGDYTSLNSVRLKPQPSHSGKVAKEFEMKLDIQWWHSIQHNIVGFVPTINGKMLVIKSTGSDFLGYKADEVHLEHIVCGGDEFALYAVCKRGVKVEEIRLLNPIIVELLGIDTDEILLSTTFI